MRMLMPKIRYGFLALRDEMNGVKIKRESKGNPMLMKVNIPMWKDVPPARTIMAGKTVL